MDVVLVAPHTKISTPLFPLMEKEWLTRECINMFQTIVFLRKSGLWQDIYALAHPQVNRDNPRSFFVLNPENKEVSRVWSGSYIVINPVFKPQGTLKKKREGCLTFPRAPMAPTMRYEKGTLFWKTPDNADQITFVSGRLAQVVQHEIDHLNGKYIYMNQEETKVPGVL